MSVAVGLLDFYILEASEYIDQLDSLVGAAVQTPPDSTPFVTAARALRGSSTMAKLLRMAELAGSVERVGRGLRDGSMRWEPELRSAVVAAIDDMRILLRGVRGWSASEEQRAAARVAELRRFIPDGGAAPNASVGGAVSPTYFASEIEGVASALDAFVAAPADRAAFNEALGRVRALRGISALKDVPPIGDVADALEYAAKWLGADGRSVTPQHIALFDASAQVLRRAARELRTTGRPDASAPEVRRFADAAAALQQESREEEHVVPVTKLFFNDEGPHIVSRADRPPTTPEARLRSEITAPAEHLRRLVADVVMAASAIGRDRAVTELRAGLRAVRATLDSFGLADAGRFFGAAAADPSLLDPVRLASIDAAAGLLASPAVPVEELASRLTELGRGHAVDRAIGVGLGPLDRPPAGTVPTPSASIDAAPQPRLGATAPSPARHTPGRTEAAAPRRTPPTPTGAELQQFLQTGIAGFNDLSKAPLAPPAPLDDAVVVPIDELLYRGRAALERAIEVRDLIRLSSGNTDEALEELFDLLDLAAAE